jgi:WhiB family redox-sensing transcriptional regulator
MITVSQWTPIHTLLTDHDPGTPTANPSLPHPPSWTEQANCREANPEHFYGTDHRPLYEDDITRARTRYCTPCPVRARCLRHALTHPEEHGIWAGTTSRERKRIQLALKRGETTLEEVLHVYATVTSPQWRSLRETEDPEEEADPPTEGCHQLAFAIA